METRTAAGEIWTRTERTHRDAGAATVEFALVFVLFLTLVFGVFEAGRAVWLAQALSAASREAARYGMGNATVAGLPQYLDCAGMRNAARARVPDVALADSDITITFRHGNGTTSPCGASPRPEIFDGDRVVVTVTKPLDVNLPFVPLDGLVLRGSAQRGIYTGVSR
jgi:Flp pilus assembly protein TadG